MPAALLLFLPVLGAFLTHAPVLRFDLLRGLKRPLDGGRSFRGRRIFGDNKTWRGASMMFVGVLGATVALGELPAYTSRLPGEAARANPWLLGALLGLGVALGELPNSFIKRQLGVAPGAQVRSPLGILLSVIDQGDFVIGIWIALLPIYVLSIGEALTAFAVVAVVHYVVNVIGFLIGARKTWI